MELMLTEKYQYVEKQTVMFVLKIKDQSLKAKPAQQRDAWAGGLPVIIVKMQWK